MLIIKRSNCVNTAFCIVLSVSDRPVCTCTPDDEHSVARNMYRITIINVLYNVIVHQVGHLPRAVPGSTYSKTKFDSTAVLFV